MHEGKGYVNLPILIFKLNVTNSKELISDIVTNSKELISDIKHLLNNLQDTKQITK